MAQRRKDITSIDTALRIYYSKSEIGSPEMKELFGDMCNSSLTMMRKPVLEVSHSRKNRHKKALKNGMNRRNSFDFSQSVAFIPRFA